MEHEGISLLDLGPIPLKLHYTYANMPKFHPAPQIPNVSDPSTSDKGSTAWRVPTYVLISYLLSGLSMLENRSGDHKPPL